MPPEVVKITNIPETKPRSTKEKSISGFSLVAGYSDSEEEENDEIKSVFIPKSEPTPQVSHSTLFPITQPVDVKDFQPKIEDTKEVEEKSPPDFGVKAFQRKKRIGVALMNTAKKKVEESKEPLRRGLGFTNDSDSTDKGSLYPGFAKGGVMFVKSDVLNPSLPKNETNDRENSTEKVDETINQAKVEEMYSTLLEKLGFLNSAHSEIPPTQTMVIQAEVRPNAFLFCEKNNYLVN